MMGKDFKSQDQAYALHVENSEGSESGMNETSTNESVTQRVKKLFPSIIPKVHIESMIRISGGVKTGKLL